MDERRQGGGGEDSAELRLLDVLLEEQFARDGDGDVAERPASRWLAAAVMLLGVGAVVGVAWLRHAEQAARRVEPVQQPQGKDKTAERAGQGLITPLPKSLEAKNLNELDDLLQRVKSIHSSGTSTGPLAPGNHGDWVGCGDHWYSRHPFE